MAGTFDWDVAQKLHSVPFDALIFAAILKADTRNLEQLLVAFPHLVAEANLHYHGNYNGGEPQTTVTQERVVPTDCACAGNYVCQYHTKLRQMTTQQDNVGTDTNEDVRDTFGGGM